MTHLCTKECQTRMQHTRLHHRKQNLTYRVIQFNPCVFGNIIICECDFLLLKKKKIVDSNVLTPSLQPNVSNHIPGNVSMNSQTNMSNRIMSPSSAPQMQILQPTTQLPSQKPRTTQVLPTASAWNDPPPFFFEKPISSSVSTHFDSYVLG